MLPSPFAPVSGGLRVAVRLTANASRAGIAGVAEDADGGAVVKAAVTAPPEGGKANAALIKLLAKQWRIPKSAIDIVQGATDRRKVLFIAGDALRLRQHLEHWMATRS